MAKIYPYTVTSLSDLKGETWEDIPFLDGLYEVSSFGRIKRCAREVHTIDGRIMRFKERIIRSYPDVQKNKTVSDEVYHLAACVSVDNRRYKFSVSRLVYYCFIKKFSLDDFSLIVYSKDGDGKNINVSNLRLSDLSGRSKRIFERGRLKKQTETTFAEYLRTRSLRSSNPYCKQVSQYNSNGKFIHTFPSIRVASTVSGVSENGILSVLKGRQIRSGGFAWAYGTRRKVDVVAIRKANIERRNRMIGRKVTQYDLKGNRIATFYTIADASRKTKTNTSEIHAVLSGRQRSANGYIWKNGFGKESINVKGYLTGVSWRAQKQQKKITKYNLKGRPVKTYESIKQAAEKEGVSDGYLSMAAKQKLVVKGFLWKLA